MTRSVAVALLAASVVPAQTRVEHEELDRRVRAATAGFQGTVRLYAENIDTGAAYTFRGSERVRTASTIKLPVMAAVFAAVDRGEAKWTDEMVLRNGAKVPGSGILQELSDGTRLTLKDVVTLMIVVSDNTAANMVLDRFGSDAVNTEMERLGLKQTLSLGRIGGGGPKVAAARLPENSNFGIGVSTPQEMVLLLEKIERGQVVSAAASKEMIEILKRQQYKDGIGRHLPEPVASKSGALDHLRSDVGIAYTPGGRIAIAVTVDDMPEVDYSPDNVGNKLISDLSRILVEGLGFTARPPLRGGLETQRTAENAEKSQRF